MRDEFDLICVVCDGKSATWTRNRDNGNVFFTGDVDIVKPAKDSIILGYEVPVFGLNIKPNNSPIGALAALFASNPGRTIFIDSNVVEVLDFVNNMQTNAYFESPLALVEK